MTPSPGIEPQTPSTAQAPAQEQSKAVTAHKQVTIRPGMTAEEYVKESIELHRDDKRRGPINGGVLDGAQYVGNMMLAVIPKNRFWCAMGLTAGGFAGLKFAGLLAGHRLSDGVPSKPEDYHTLLQPLHGVLKHDHMSNAMGDRWKKAASLFVFTGVSFAGVMAGAYYAYRSSRQRNSHPTSLEDYSARVGQDQGDKWRWLAASSGVFGSTSGYFLAPIPGISYGPSIEFYTVLNQDRKIIVPGLKKLSGTKTGSYLGLREGMEYICRYAVNNPSKDPMEMEYMALTVMGPLADATGTRLTPENIKLFVDKINAVRDQYMQDGGIPKEKRAEALHAMELQFKGKGLDKTFYECGLDTMKIDFTKLNGITGKIGDSLGAKKHVLKEQEGYRALATKWRKDWMPAAAPAQTGDEVAMVPAQGKTFASDNLKKQSPVTGPRPASHQDAAYARHHDNGDILATSL